MSCPDENLLAQLAQGLLPAGQRAVATDHLDECARCRRLVGELARLSLVGGLAAGSPPPAGAPPPLLAGAQVGRYVILRLLGAGGMGVVWAAYDPDLDRTVALKVLRGDSGARAEAQALARLAHPNVVTVHEVGQVDGHDYVVMEYVAGGTLAEWLAAHPRPWREVLDAFLAAGRGLAAAHAAGLVHRDVKPSNVLVGADGRVRVTDFGLAAPAGARGAAGTPRYMAPEQSRGEPADARTDQYGFCIALDEAAPAAPGWLRRATARGRAADPADRWPSLAALCDALGRDRAARRRRALAALAAAALLAAGFAAARAVARPDDACAGAAAQLAGAWDGALAAEIEAAFAATGRAYAADAAARTRRALDDYAAAWTAAHTATCRATRRGEQSAALLDARMDCLARRRGELAALAALLARGADDQAVERALPALAALASPAGCIDAPAAPRPADPAARVQSDAFYALLDQAVALERAGKPAAGLALARAVPDTGFAPLTAAASFARGRLEMASGDAVAAEASLLAALAAGAAAGDDALVAQAWIRLLAAVGDRQGRAAAALPWLPFAEAAVARAGGGQLLRAALLDTRGALQLGAGDFAGAAASRRAALDLRRARLGDGHLEVATSRQGLCEALRQIGELAEAEAECRAALAGFTAALGEAHPTTAATLVSLASVLGERGDLAAARPLNERALALLEAALGADHPRALSARSNLAGLLERAGDYDAALPHFERVLAARERTLAPDHPLLARTLATVGFLRAERGELAAARAHLERALAIQERALPPDHPDLAATLLNLGEVALREGRAAAAEPLLARALAITERAYGPAHAELAFPLVFLGDCLVAQGRAAAAIPLLERAIALPDLVAANQAEARFALARALWAARRDRPRALALAAEAQALSPDPEPIAAWIAARK